MADISENHKYKYQKIKRAKLVKFYSFSPLSNNSPEIFGRFALDSEASESFSAFLHLSVCCEDHIGLFVATDFGHQQIL